MNTLINKCLEYVKKCDDYESLKIFVHERIEYYSNYLNIQLPEEIITTNAEYLEFEQNSNQGNKSKEVEILLGQNIDFGRIIFISIENHIKYKQSLDQVENTVIHELIHTKHCGINDHKYPFYEFVTQIKNKTYTGLELSRRNKISHYLSVYLPVLIPIITIPVFTIIIIIITVK